MSFRRWMLAAAAVAFSAGAVAQEPPPTQSALVEIEGTVYVNTGEKFELVPNGTRLRMGDQIMAMDASGALVKYDDGCDYRVKAGTVVTLSDRSPCAGAMLSVQPASPGSVALGGGAAPAGTAGLSGGEIATIVAVVALLPVIAEEINDGDPVSP